MKYFLLFLLSLVVLFVGLMIVSSAILNGFPKEHWLRKFWERHIVTSEDLDPPTE
jgi:hypothetical protein